MLAKAVLPFALLFILSGCGGAAQKTRGPTAGVRGQGFTFEVLQGWRISRPRDAVVARDGKGLVSVTVFPLRKAYDPARFDDVVKALDSVAARLATAAHSSVSESESITVADRKTRAYRYDGKRIAFVLEGAREYQLFCSPDSDACDLLFESFSLQ